MFSEYLIDLIDTWEKSGVEDKVIIDRIVNRWDVDRELIEEILKYNR